MANLSIIPNNNEIEVKVINLDPEYNHRDRYFRIYYTTTNEFPERPNDTHSESSFKIDGQDAEWGRETPSFTIINQSTTNSVTYKIYTEIIYTSGGNPVTITFPTNAPTSYETATAAPKSETPETPEPEIDEFDWEEGQNTPHGIAYAAITTNGPVVNFNHSVWNDMVDKLLEIYNNKGYTWATNNEQGATLNASETIMNTSDKVLTAARFNSFRYNIGRYNSTGISKVNTGDTVLGNDFITLVEKMNGLISL